MNAMNNKSAILKNLTRIVPAALLAAGALWLAAERLTATSYQYYQDFSDTATAIATGTATGGWANISGNDQFGYGRDGAFFAPDEAWWSNGANYTNPSAIDLYNGKLSIYGKPNNNSLDRNSIWFGKVGQFIPKNSSVFGGANFSASATQPIGFMLTRTHASIDTDDDTRTDDNYHKANINVWLVKDRSGIAADWDTYAGLFYFFEQGRVHASDAVQRVSRFGYFDGSDNFPGNTSTPAYGPKNDATSVFISGAAPWNNIYDDEPTTSTAAAWHAYRTSAAGVTPLDLANQNNNPLGIRIQHDGSRVRVYLNPNPQGGAAVDNQFYMFGQSEVTWNSDMKVMIGHESAFFLPENVSAEYDDFVVRTVCDTMTASISPQKVLSGGTDISYTLSITPAFQATDSGIGEILIAKPAFMTNAWQLATVAVSSDYDNDNVLEPLVVSTSTMPTARDRAYVTSHTNYDGKAAMLKIVFWSVPGVAASTGVIKSGTANPQIVVRFNLKTADNANATGGDFAVYANLEKYGDYNWTYAQMVSGLPTTGMKKAAPATTGGLLVQTYGQPQAYAALTASPAIINQGWPNEAVVNMTYEISTKGVSDRPAISQAIIEVPDLAFTVSNVSSMLIGTANGTIAVTNGSGKRFIVLNYNTATGGLPSPNGYDRITFTVYGTPFLAEGVLSQVFTFPSKVNSAGIVEGTSPQNTGTSALFPSQTLTVAAKNPEVSGWVFPSSIANNTNNSIVAFNVQNNAASSYNTIKYLRILVDTTKITSVSYLSNTIAGATGSYTAPYLTVTYADGALIGKGSSDKIWFRMGDNRLISDPEATATFTFDANNRNGIAWVAGSEDSRGWTMHFLPPDPKPLAYVTPNAFVTSDVTNTFKVFIYNNGPAGDTLKQARILVPAIFTNFTAGMTVDSVLLGPTYIDRVTIKGTNWIWLKYADGGKSIGSLNDAVGLYPHDEVTIKVADNVYNTPNRYWFEVFADNETGNAFTNDSSATNRASPFVPESQYVDLLYPPVKAAFDIESRYTNTYALPAVEQYGRLDATTATNLLVVRIKNNGAPGNALRKVFITLPDAATAGIVAGSAASKFFAAGVISIRQKTALLPAQISIAYDNEGTNIPAGFTEEISFRMIDSVADSMSVPFSVSVNNDRELKVLSDYLPAGNVIEFFVPPARAAAAILPRVLFTTPEGAETTTVVCTVTNTGGGSNKLRRTRIAFPALTGLTVVSASNAVFAGETVTGIGTSAHFALTATDFIVDYGTGGSMVAPGQTDHIYLNVSLNNPTTALGSVDWDVRVDNNATITNVVTLMSGGSLSQNLTAHPFFTVYESTVDDHSILTSNLSNTVTIQLRNSTNGFSQAIARVKITVPALFNMPYTLIQTAEAATYSTVDHDVIVSYTTPLPANGARTVKIRLNDDFDESETTTVWDVKADYGDGIWRDIWANRLADSTVFTNALHVELPTATASAWLDPAILFVDMTAQTYTVSVSNTGIVGNHIRLIEVTPPAFITNVTGVVGTSGHAFTNCFRGGKLYIQYSSTRLLTGQLEKISFVGHDNRTTSAVDPFPWTVRVANVASTNDMGMASVPLGSTLETTVTTPGFRAEYHATPETIDTSSGTNVFTVYIDNKSPQTSIVDSYIEYAKIFFDPARFVTNGIAVKSTRGATVTLATNCVTLFYATPLAPKTGDQVTVTLRDKLFQGDASTAWSVLAKFDTMSYYTNAVVANGTNRVDFTMPLPSVAFGLAVPDLYTTHTNARLRIWVTNRASGSNLLEEFVLALPAGLSGAGYGLGAIASTNFSFAPLALDARYRLGTGRVPGTGDILTLALTNPLHDTGTYSLTARASNSTRGADAVAGTGAGSLRIVTPPQARISPNAIDTTTGTNTVSVFIDNNGSGDSAVLRARVKIPAIYSRVVSVQSSRILATAITNNGNEYFFEYSSAAIANGGNDTLTFVLEDSFAHGVSNVSWQVQVDNGNGYAHALPTASEALVNKFTMPPVAAGGWLGTVWVYAAETKAHAVTNTITLSVSNSGRGSNNVFRAYVRLPLALTNISAYTSSRGVVKIENVTNLYVTYTNLGASGLLPGQRDTVSFKLVHRVDMAQSFDYVFKADNGDGNGLVAVQAPSTIVGAQQRMDVFIKEEDSEVYLGSAQATYMWEATTDTTIYTMDDAALLKLVVKNKSRRFGINRVVVPLSSSVYSITALTSGFASGTAAPVWSLATNTLIIDYSVTNIMPQQAETISVNVSYNKDLLKDTISASGPITNALVGLIRYAGSEVYSQVQATTRKYLVLDNARFGRFRGTVLPLGLGSTVTMKATGSASIATNIAGTAFQAQVNTNTGAYIVDKIPANVSYQMLIMPPIGETVTNNGRVIVPVAYDTLQVNGLSVDRNVVRQIDKLTMVYGKLNAQALGEQQVVCPADALTKLVVPSGTLLEGVGVNISIGVMSDVQQEDANTSPALIGKPLDSTILSVWNFKIVNLSDNTVIENGFKKDVELVIHYDVPANQGWTDDKLAIWYWKPATREWVAIGGVVDAATRTIKAHVGYLHTCYAVMARSGNTTQAIHSVKASPNPFTPDRGDGQFSNMKLTFAFAKAYATYEVKIYSMQGKLVQHITQNGSYAQGEAFWNGRDRNGFKVRGGVYLYQIIAGENVYSGSVLVLR